MMRTTEKNTISIIAGDGKDGDGELAIHSKLICPLGIAIHPHSGDIYITEQENHRICKISSSSGIISAIAGNGTDGFSGDGGLAIDAQLSYPHGIAIHPHSSDIYFCDHGNNRIRKISLSNGIISTIAGNGHEGINFYDEYAIDTKLNNPEGIAIHPINGDIYFCDSGNHMIRKISSNGKISTIAGDGDEGFSGDGGLAIDAQLNNPDGIAIHPRSSDIYFCDSNNHRIRKISSNGIISTIAGDGIQRILVDRELAINAQLHFPEGIAIHPRSGDIYFCDNNHRICKVSSLNSKISTIVGNEIHGSNDDNGKWTIDPSGIAIHPRSGDIYFSDSDDNRIRQINSSMNHVYNLKKYDRDIIKGTSITSCKCVINIYHPNMFNIITNEQLLNQFNANHQEIIQHLIDLIIYDESDNNLRLSNYELIDILFIIGLINGNESNSLYFQGLTLTLIDKFMNLFNHDDNVCSKIIEKLMILKDQFKTLDNSLLDQMIDYSLKKASELLRRSCDAINNPIFTKYILLIAAKLAHEPSIITINENTREQINTIEGLFNDKKTSDIIIKIENNEYHCHKTIISSKSTYYEALFNSGFEFQDLKDNIHTVDTNEFDENSQTIILKYCYGIFDSESISDLTNMPLFKCALFHEMKKFANYCVKNMKITIDNYCNLVNELGTDNEILFEHFIQFAMDNSKKLLGNMDLVKNIPIEIKNEVIVRQNKN